MPTSPGFSDFMVYPWRWGENAHNVTLSPGSISGAASPTGSNTGGVDGDAGLSPDHLKDGIRRGRPRADTVRELINEGENSSSRIRCNICNRVFPREKSLQAHKRTHTGCGSRFTHANRHCPKHPYARLKREEPSAGQGSSEAADNKAVAEWLSKYWQTREQRIPHPKIKGLQKTDQEQQDPLEYLQSDEDEEEIELAEEKTSVAARRRLQEQRERLHGALALIELANLSSAQLRP
ncbi:ZN367 protein, partial [Polypterus senegalus]